MQTYGGGGDTAPRILNHGTRWKRALTFTHQHFIPEERTPVPSDRRLGDIQSRSGDEKKNPALPEIHPRSSSPLSSHYSDGAIPTPF
jgi:hypothetical protein